MMAVGRWHKKRCAVHGFQTFQRCGHRNLWQLIINYYYVITTTAAAKVELCAFMHKSPNFVTYTTRYAYLKRESNSVRPEREKAV